MATYRQDVTQDLKPSMADPSGAIKAEQLRGSVFEQALGAAGSIFKQKVEMDVKAAEAEADSLRQEFMRKGMATEAYAKAAGARDLVAKGVAEDNAFMGPVTDAQGIEFDRNKVVLSALTEDAMRLKEAADGGMSNEQYIARINALTKKGIAQYPGLADEIRKRIGNATGLPGADEWADRQYVASRFTETKAGKGDSDKAIANDIKRAADMGMFTEETLWKMRETNPAEYAATMKQVADINHTQTQAKALETKLAQQRGVADEQARKDQAGFPAFMEASIQTDFLVEQTKQGNTLFKEVNNILAKGGATGDANLLVASTELHSANVRRHVDNRLETSRRMLGEYFRANPNVSAAVQTEMMSTLTRRADEIKQQYASKDGLVLMATIAKTYSDQSLDVQTRLHTLATQQIQALGNMPLTAQYFQGGPARENFKKQYPELYSMIDGQVQNTLSAAQNIRTIMSNGRDLGVVSSATVNAGQNMEPTPRTPGASSEAAKAAQQAVVAGVGKHLETLQSTGEIPAEGINSVGTMLNNMIKDGSGVRGVEQQYTFYRNNIKLIPEADLVTVRDSINSNVDTALFSMAEKLKKYNEFKKVQLAFGVTPGGGFGVVPVPTNVGSMVEAERYKKAVVDFNATYGNAIKGTVMAYALANDKSIEEVSKEYVQKTAFASAAVGPESKRRVASKTTTGVSLGGPQPTVGPLTTEKKALDAMGVGRQDLADLIAQLKTTLQDVKPDSETFKRISRDIAEAESELKK
jgi:hypothetical protein